MGGEMKTLLLFLCLSIFANETAVKIENNQIKLWIEEDRKAMFKEGTFFLFDNDGMNQILAYKKTSQLFDKYECPKCDKNNTLWYLASFGAGAILGGLLVKVMK